jgi:hypothetical protein
MLSRRRRPPLALLVSLALAGPAAAQAPLHRRIDEAVAARAGSRPLAALSSDAEFLRRVSLDLTGTVPTAAQARAFLADATPDKRARLIDQLLAGPEHARHMAHVLDVMLMERRPAKHVPQAQWHEYLRASFEANKPWDEMVRELLGGDGADPQKRVLAKFILERDAEPNLVTRDISRLFLGMNLQCAQCHDHPRVDEYKQEHYYGLFAFVNRTVIVPDKATRLIALGEKADGEATYQSVFDPAKVTKTGKPRVPYGALVKEEAPEKGKEYVTAPANGVRPVPTFSRRSRLGPALTAGDSPAFRRNIANRLWAQLMGRGLVHPLDMDHPANPPSHPELLTLLADDLAEHKYDMRYFLREIALSQTYQRSSEPPPGVKDVAPATFTVAALRPLAAEQLAFALMQASGLTDAERTALGGKTTEAALYARLSPNLAPFVKAFGATPGRPEEFDPTLDQALFLANGALVRSWLAPRAGNLVDRLSRLQGDALADELYLGVYGRLPNADERKDLAAHLKGRDADRVAALQEAAWALLASTEFRFNH